MIVHKEGDVVIANVNTTSTMAGEIYIVSMSKGNMIQLEGKGGNFYLSNCFWNTVQCIDNTGYEDCLVIGKYYPVVNRFINSDNCKMVTIVLSGGINVQFRAERFK